MCCSFSPRCCAAPTRETGMLVCAGCWLVCVLTLYRSWLMKMMVQSHLLAWLATLRSATLIRRAWLPICVTHTRTEQAAGNGRGRFSSHVSRQMSAIGLADSWNAVTQSNRDRGGTRSALPSFLKTVLFTLTKPLARSV